MLAGMKANQDKLSKRGVDTEEINRLENAINMAAALDAPNRKR